MLHFFFFFFYFLLLFFFFFFTTKPNFSCFFSVWAPSMQASICVGKNLEFGRKKEKKRKGKLSFCMRKYILSSFIVSKIQLVWLKFKLTTYHLKFNTLSIKIWLKFKLSIIKIFYPILFNLMFFFFNFWRKET